MSCPVTLAGQLVVNPSSCSSSCSVSAGVTMKSQAIALLSTPTSYERVQSSDCAVAIATSGAVGASFVDLPALDGLGAISLLYVRSSAQVILRLNALPATLAASGATWPYTFAGTEVFAVTVDGTAVSTTFSAGSTTAAEAAAQINSAALLAGVTHLVASVSGGQLLLTGAATGRSGSLVITTPLAVIGYSSASSASSQGEDVSIRGTYGPVEHYPALSNVMVSGSASIEVIAAGSAA